MAAVKAKEKEMKDEKEAARKVRYVYTLPICCLGLLRRGGMKGEGS